MFLFFRQFLVILSTNKKNFLCQSFFIILFYQRFDLYFKVNKKHARFVNSAPNVLGIFYWKNFPWGSVEFKNLILFEIWFLEWGVDGIIFMRFFLIFVKFYEIVKKFMILLNFFILDHTFAQNCANLINSICLAFTKFFKNFHIFFIVVNLFLIFPSFTP